MFDTWDSPSKHQASCRCPCQLARISVDIKHTVFIIFACIKLVLQNWLYERRPNAQSVPSSAASNQFFGYRAPDINFCLVKPHQKRNVYVLRDYSPWARILLEAVERTSLMGGTNKSKRHELNNRAFNLSNGFLHMRKIVQKLPIQILNQSMTLPTLSAPSAFI